MQRLARLLRTVVAAAGTQVIVVQMPDHRRPRVVQHPLNHTGRRVLVASVAFEHGALGLVGERLRLPREIDDAIGFSVPSLDRRREHLDVLELAAARVEVPDLVDWPQVIGRKHPRQAFDRWDRRARANLGREAERAAVPGVGEPVRRRDIVVRSAHLHSAWPAHRSGRLGRARQRRTRPLQLALDRRFVAAVQPDEDARMVSKPQQLIAQRGGTRGVVLRVPLVPQFPLIAAAPSGHDENAFAIGEVVKVVGLELALRPDGVQTHFLDVAEFGFETRRRFGTQQHV